MASVMWTGRRRTQEAAPWRSFAMSCQRPLLLLGVLLSPATAAQITNVEVQPSSYVTGLTPNSLQVTFTVDTTINGASNTLRLDINNGAWVNGATDVPTLSGGASGTGVAASAVTTGTYVITVGSGGASFATGSPCVITIPSTVIAALPAAGTSVSITITSTGTALAAGANNPGAFTVVAAPIINWVGSQEVGETPTLLHLQVETPFALAVNDVITIEPSQGLFQAPVSAVTDTASADLTLTNLDPSSTYAASTSVLATLTVQTAAVSAGTTLTIVLGANLFTTLPSNVGAVTLTIKMGTPPNQHSVVDAYSGWLSIVIGSDPVARFGNVVRVFELPVHTLVPLVTLPDLKISGSVFEGGGPWEQWFDRFLITTPGEERFMEIKIVKLDTGFNHSKARTKALQTMEVTLGYGSVSSPRYVTQLQDVSQGIPQSFLGYAGLVRKVHRFSSKMRECVDLAGMWSHFYVCSRTADEYYGDARHLAYKYMHLDVYWHQVKDYSVLSGVLPELWGLVPMSETTKAYVKEDRSKTTLAGSPQADLPAPLSAPSATATGGRSCDLQAAALC
eukprot:TRINITY_DN18823_c0_g1_i1.p1 TRINITY_DN18823_c0_g1~~TRINITY_DN18823_c0_g1_i1.p1  ORF type:complete len:564 (-),score=99.64 TRINITY_DN18823_c0_g1_i1:66-1757(-)